MSEITDIILQQKECREAIEYIEVAFKKLALAKRTKTHIEQRVSKLDRLFEEFVERDAGLQTVKTENEDRQYFTKNYAETTKARYEEIKKFLESKYAEIVETERKFKVDKAEVEKQISDAEELKRQKEEEIQQATNKLKELENTLRGEQSEGEDNVSYVEVSNQLLLEQKEIMKNLNRILVSLETVDIEKSHIYLEQKLKIAEKYWDMVTKNHMELITQQGADVAQYIDLDFYSSTEEHYLSTSVNVLEKLSKTSTSNQNIKLPQFSLPTFSGNYLDWKQFENLVSETLLPNKNIGPSQKLLYLKQALKGEASNLVKNFAITEENFTVVWDILNERYNNKRVLLNHQLEKLFSMKDLAIESASGIRSLYDNSREALLAIENTGIPTENWDPIIVHVLLKKLDKESRRIFEQNLKNPREVQNLEMFFDFLKTRFNSLEATESKPSSSRAKGTEKNSTNSKNFHSYTKQCIVCKADHKIFNCEKFKIMGVNKKIELAKKEKLCLNCLTPSHIANNCKSKFSCRVCNAKHHTLLHKEKSDESRTPVKKDTVPEPECSAPDTKSFHATKLNTVLLATAKIKILSASGEKIEFRALLDQGSQSTFIAHRAAQLLRLRAIRSTTVIGGLGNENTQVSKRRIQLELFPRFDANFTIQTDAVIVPSITTLSAPGRFKAIVGNLFENLQLADPDYLESGPIDVLLGADILAYILKDGIIKNEKYGLVAQNTDLGWIISGGTNKIPHKSVKSLCTNVEFDLQKFWEAEEVEIPTKTNDLESQQCEEIYNNTTIRNSEGRYIVCIPFKDNEMPVLGNSKKRALARYLNLEKKFVADKELHQEYVSFINEYITLGHMKVAHPITNQNVYFLPHHAVINKEKRTTKLRVVFDGSAKTDTGVSLNDKMLNGPILQEDLFSILIRWRKYKIAFCADICKMYRQILMNNNFFNYQRILWRNQPDEPIKEYVLTTVTYGTKAAPFLAIKTLRRLAVDEQQQHPRAADVALNDFYVDDLISGCDTVEEALEIQNEINLLLMKGGFVLRKWLSNSSLLLQNVTEDEVNIKVLHSDDAFKTLGTMWNPVKDMLSYKVHPSLQVEPTKREFLSEASKLFDPLGLLSPVIINFKLLFQDIWQSGISWDERLPEKIQKKWKKLQSQFCLLERIQIPRWIGYTNGRKVQLHGFSDASAKAYAAVVYARITDNFNKITVILLAAKTRVAPLKAKLTIPRLELNGAVLLTQLVEKLKCIKIDVEKTVYWTDSTVVLAWLQHRPDKLTTYVANRTKQILKLSTTENWYHVSSKDNPADCASRGVQPEYLINHDLWWNGPVWLQEHQNHWPQQPLSVSHVVEEIKSSPNVKCTFQNTQDCNLVERFSNWKMLVRVVAQIYRFFKNCRGKVTKISSLSLTTEELKDAEIKIIKMVQKTEFYEEIRLLTSGKELPANCNILALNPVVDNNGILRVGGRLQNSNLKFEQKHPILLPHNHHLSTLVIRKFHEETMHGGATLTLATIRTKFWIVKGKGAVRKQIKQCIQCTRFRGKTCIQQMGNLPVPRVTMSRPFTHTGVDYAGPLSIKMSKGRGCKTYKGYISVFICLATKALHLEAVTDLTAEGFLNAFKRFSGRRGLPSDMYSDNGTNFMLASKILIISFKQFKESYHPELMEGFTNKGVEWHFIPPAAPHMGGIWEAGVKSVKHHLRRVLKNAILTYEEMSTVLVQIESCLNSRPLCPLSEDIEDLNVLTPGHFLVGGPLLSFPAKSDLENNSNCLNRFRYLQKIQQDFWKKWNLEYLNELQQRPKWLKSTKNLETGDMVIIKQDNVPPSAWPLGRIVQTHTGNDGRVRVTTVRTANGELQRPLTKLVQLPIKAEEGRLIEKSINRTDTQAMVKNKRVATSSIFLTLLAILLVPGAGAAYVNISRFDQPPGIYFENIGQIQTMTSEWNIFINFNLSSYWQEYEAFKLYKTEMSSICFHIQTNNQYCWAIIQEVEQKIALIEQNNDLLHNLSGHSRYTRSAIDIVGNIANKLFGVLDSDYADYIEEQFDKVQNNENHILKLLKNQSSIAEITKNIIKKNTDDIQAQFDTIKKFIVSTWEDLNSTQANEVAAEKFNSLTAFVSLAMNNYESLQGSLLDIIFDVHHGKINPQIINPVQMQQQINLILTNMPSNLILPTKNLLQVYKLMSIKTRTTQNSIIFKIKIPLSMNEQFQLFHVIPVPFNQNNELFAIQLPAPFIAHNLLRDRYYYVTEHQLQLCITSIEGVFLCTHHHPIYNIDQGSASCESSMFTTQNHLKDCVIVNVHQKTFWAKLFTPNSWIFSVIDKFMPNIICDTKVPTPYIEGTGIITLQSACTLKTNELSLITQTDTSSKLQLQSSFIISKNITNNSLFQKNVPKLELKKLTLHDELQQLESKITNQSSSIDNSDLQLEHHHIHHYTAIYLVLSIGCIIIISKLCCGKDNKDKRSTNEQTAADIEL